MPTNERDESRAAVATLLRRSQAQAGLTRALDGFPVELAGRRMPGHAHTGWQQVEHMRRAAADLVSYCRDADYRPLDWPAGYWPASAAPPSARAWSASIQAVLQATEEMATLVEDPAVDPLADVPAAAEPGHHVLRAALVLLDHNAYHTGQLVALRQALGAWAPPEPL